MEINWNQIETKWRTKWDESKDFETNPNEKPKKFITVAYPYPNSPQHIGHGRTYTLADVHSRFYRMRGFNVLFPMDSSSCFVCMNVLSPQELIAYMIHAQSMNP